MVWFDPRMAQILVSIPQKRRPDKYKEGVRKFFRNVANAVKNHFDLERLKCIIVASPGFVRSEFMDYIMEVKDENKIFTNQREKFLSVHSSSGYKHSLQEVLADETVKSRLADTKAAKETKALDTFMGLLMEEPDRAFYGRKQVNDFSLYKCI